MGKVLPNTLASTLLAGYGLQSDSTLTNWRLLCGMAIRALLRQCVSGTFVLDSSSEGSLCLKGANEQQYGDSDGTFG